MASRPKRAAANAAAGRIKRRPEEKEPTVASLVSARQERLQLASIVPNDVLRLVRDMVVHVSELERSSLFDVPTLLALGDPFAPDMLDEDWLAAAANFVKSVPLCDLFHWARGVRRYGTDAVCVKLCQGLRRRIDSTMPWRARRCLITALLNPRHPNAELRLAESEIRHLVAVTDKGIDALPDVWNLSKLEFCLTWRLWDEAMQLAEARYNPVFEGFNCHPTAPLPLALRLVDLLPVRQASTYCQKVLAMDGRRPVLDALLGRLSYAMDWEAAFPRHPRAREEDAVHVLQSLTLAPTDRNDCLAYAAVNGLDYVLPVVEASGEYNPASVAKSVLSRNRVDVAKRYLAMLTDASQIEVAFSLYRCSSKARLEDDTATLKELPNVLQHGAVLPIVDDALGLGIDRSKYDGLRAMGLCIRKYDVAICNLISSGNSTLLEIVLADPALTNEALNEGLAAAVRKTKVSNEAVVDLVLATGRIDMCRLVSAMIPDQDSVQTYHYAAIASYIRRNFDNTPLLLPGPAENL